MSVHDCYEKVAEIISRRTNLEDALAEARVSYPRINIWRSTPANDAELNNLSEEDKILGMGCVRHGDKWVYIDFDTEPHPSILQME